MLWDTHGPSVEVGKPDSQWAALPACPASTPAAPSPPLTPAHTLPAPRAPSHASLAKEVCTSDLHPTFHCPPLQPLKGPPQDASPGLQPASSTRSHGASTSQALHCTWQGTSVLVCVMISVMLMLASQVSSCHLRLDSQHMPQCPAQGRIIFLTGKKIKLNKHI